MTVPYDQAKSWPFQEARALLKHITAKGKKPGDVVTFETGYGPSGAPHIGTFAEVVRTLWVMKAFDAITDGQYQTRLIMFSDDYDALRKVPDGMPEWMAEYIGRPLTQVPNPYSEGSVLSEIGSFGKANNFRLIRFVNQILANYDNSRIGNIHDGVRVMFASATQYYQSGKFDGLLRSVWDKYDDVIAAVLPTLGENRRQTYSPFMPILNGVVIHDGVRKSPALDYWIEFEADGPNGPDEHYGSTITGGHAKLQWKVDWAMRWVHFDVDYEMSGKDLIDSVKLSSKICRILGGTPPLNMTYELFLDENGEKISKSKGNGFSLEQWFKYGSDESLMYFLFQNPKAAKPLHVGLVPRCEDEVLKMLAKDVLSPNDAAWFFKANSVWLERPDVNFSLLLNLAVVAQASSATQLVSYLGQVRELNEQDSLWAHSMADRVCHYAKDQGLYARERRSPTEAERAAFLDLANRFSELDPSISDGEAFQFYVYEVGKAHGFDPLRLWFQALYEVIFGDSSGPRFGVFTAAYGLENTIKLLREAACRQ